MNQPVRTIVVESEGEQRFLSMMQGLFRKSLQAGRDAANGERFDALHSVVVVKGPEALATLTETATNTLLAEQPAESAAASPAPPSGGHIPPASPASAASAKPPASPEPLQEPPATPSDTTPDAANGKQQPAARRQKRGSKSTGDAARS